MNECVLEVRQVSVRYGGHVVVRDVSFAVPRGSVYALLGRNGAGKSSLVRCILGQQKPYAGEAAIFGRDVWRDRAALMARVGVVPEENEAPPSMTAREIGRFLSQLFPNWDDASFVRRLDRFRVPPSAAVGSLSKGQKRQVTLASALAHRPELLILDDPTLGLDAVARKDLFSELIDEMAERNTTVLLTTHDLAAAELIATHAGVLAEGRLVLDDNLERLKNRFRRIRVNDGTELPGGRPVRLQQLAGGVEAVVADGAAEYGGESAAMSLEEIFIAVAGEES